MAENPLVFISYSHRDEGWKDQLLPHIRMLEQLGTLTMWDDRQIGVGDVWFEEITQKLNRCAVAILLVSADFLASRFCLREEVPPLLERRRRDGMLVVPILIQPCFWEGVAWLRAIQMLPRDGVAIAELAKAKRNRVFTEVAKSISAFAEQGKGQALAQAEASWPAPLVVDIDRLPTSGYDLVGRNDELKLLNDAWDQGKINIISLGAWGGVGKSTLVNKWVRVPQGRELSRDLEADARPLLSPLLSRQDAEITSLEGGSASRRKLMMLVRRNSRSALTRRNTVEILQDAAEFYPGMMEDMRAARHSIHLQYFIWGARTSSPSS